MKKFNKKIILSVGAVFAFGLYSFSDLIINRENKEISKEFIAYHIPQSKAYNNNWGDIPEDKQLMIKSSVHGLVKRGLINESILDLKELNLISDQEMNIFVFVDKDRLFAIQLKHDFNNSCSELDNIEAKTEVYDYHLSVSCPKVFSPEKSYAKVDMAYSFQSDSDRIARLDVFIIEV